MAFPPTVAMIRSSAISSDDDAPLAPLAPHAPTPAGAAPGPPPRTMPALGPLGRRSGGGQVDCADAVVTPAKRAAKAEMANETRMGPPERVRSADKARAKA